jgi:hypothetical protein
MRWLRLLCWIDRESADFATTAILFTLTGLCLSSLESLLLDTQWQELLEQHGLLMCLK